MRKETCKNLIRIVLAAVALAACVCSFCACHVFAWYIPKPYSDDQMAKIYADLKEGLNHLEHYTASVGIEQDGFSYYYNIFSDEGKTVIRYDVYGDTTAVKRGLFYNGTLKEWDVSSRAETETSKKLDDYGFLFRRVYDIAVYFKTQVLSTMSFRDDSYCWQCFPWDVGMAQMYYLPSDDNVNVSASWTIENNYSSKDFPLISEAQYRYGDENGSVWITAYSDPFGIDERITNILASYEDDKKLDEKMLYKQIYLKLGDNQTLCMELYNNDAAKTLCNKLDENDLTLVLDDYGGFEKAGELGFELPSSDEHITAYPMDVMLYQGDKLVVFYGENTWDYTSIGRIVGYSDTAFNDIINSGQLSLCVTLTLNKVD